MSKGTTIISDLRSFFSENDKNRAINAIMRVMECINIRPKQVGTEKKENCKFTNVQVLNLLVLFPFFVVRNAYQYSGSSLSRLFCCEKDMFYRFMNDGNVKWRKLLYAMNLQIEDPIEFYHNHKNSIVTQREVHNDVPTFADAIRRALRQDPDTILVGEMRDLETIGAAITAAETGHLVFGTLHTTGAAETIDRVVDSFPTTQQAQVRTQLASTLICVISQVLLKRIDKKGRVAAFEIMINTPSIAALIRDGKTFRITSDIQTGAKFGMNTLDAHLLQLYTEGKISYGDLVTKSKDPEGLIHRMQQEALEKAK